MWQPVVNISGSMPSKAGSPATTSQLAFILVFVRAKGTAQLRHEAQHTVPRNMQFRGAVRHASRAKGEPKQDRDGSCETAVAAACKLVGCNAVWTLTQAGGDTTTWSVCTCWPEAVTTGASVCSCTAVTVPCVCRQGRTIQ